MTLISVLLAVHWIWTGDMIENATSGFAIGVALIWALVLRIRSPQALEPGPPAMPPGPEAIPSASLGAVLIALSLVTVGVGFVFGSFLVFMGAGLFTAAAWLLRREILDEHRARGAALHDRGPK
jgi:Na+/H+-translocating membrane pyrophosphatase